MELRCESKKHGELTDGYVEFKCSSRFCGAAPGVVVLHRFSALTGKALGTTRFRDPGHDAMKEGSNATEHNPVAVRPA